MMLEERLNNFPSSVVENIIQCCHISDKRVCSQKCKKKVLQKRTKWLINNDLLLFFISIFLWYFSVFLTLKVEIFSFSF